MDYTTASTATSAVNTTTEQVYVSPIDELLDKYENILQQHRAENPDLYRLVELQKKRAIAAAAR